MNLHAANTPGPGRAPLFAALATAVPMLVVAGLWALMAPANLPEPITARLTEAIRAAVADPAFRQQIIAQGADPVGGTPAEFATYWTRESEKWGNLIRSRNIRMPS